VGAAGTAMKTLDQLKLAEVIRAVVKQGTPFLGICLGTQIIFDRSEEDGGTKCIGLIPGLVRLFKPVERFDKVPQIGWNNVSLRRQHPVMEGIGNDSYFYFVHSYYPAPTDKECVLGETTYANTTFASIIAQENLIATQFHPEKSGRVGLQLLGNFLNWKP